MPEHEENEWKIELYSSWIILCVWGGSKTISPKEKCPADNCPRTIVP